MFFSSKVIFNARKSHSGNMLRKEGGITEKDEKEKNPGETTTPSSASACITVAGLREKPTGRSDSDG